jgi:hypothetical protein
MKLIIVNLEYTKEMRCDRCKLKGVCRTLRAKSKDHFRWSFHNLIAHPASEIAWLLGFKKLSDEIHDKTVPKHDKETDRG